MIQEELNEVVEEQKYKSYTSNPEKLPLFIMIPGVAIADNKLTANQKILLGLIIGLSKATGYCYASNRYLSEALGNHPNSISRDINNLVKYEYIKSKVNYYTDERKIYLLPKSFISINKNVINP
jgi:Helix-turn-helix domain